MGTLWLLLLAILLPTGVGYSVLAARRVARWFVGWRDDHRAPPAESLDRLSANLQRLHAQLDQAEFAPAIPAKRMRRDAVRAAYLDTLTAACTRLDVVPPERATGKVPQAEIYRVEADLRAHGLDVRGR